MNTDRARSAARYALATVLATALGSCIASNVVAREDRAVITAAEELQWSLDRVESLEGLFESVDIRGEAAAHLWKVYYWFEHQGRFTAAALTVGADGPVFQTLEGQWEIADGGLILDGAQPAELARAHDSAGVDYVRIATPGGAVVMRHVETR